MTRDEIINAIRAGVIECDTRDREYMRQNFNLGSAGQHCRRYSSYAPAITAAASRLGYLIIDMPSEYYEPHYVERGDWATIDPAAILAEAAKVEAERQAEAERIAALREQHAKEDAEREARTVRVGKMVRVKSGRKVPIGTVGELIRHTPSDFDKVAIRIGGGRTVYTYYKNLEVAPEGAAVTQP